MKKSYLGAFVLLLSMQFAEPLTANDRKFAYVYETSVLPVGTREIEIWNTYRTNRGYFYRALDQRIEFEFGVSNNLMSALYLNASSVVMNSNGEGVGGSTISNSSVSISNEWKYKMFDRVADPLGVGLYGEATLGLDEFELEGKLLVDKQIGKWLIAFNAVAENEWKTELVAGNSHTSSELAVELNVGIAFAPHPQWSIGLEARNHNIIAEGEWEHSALFAGPVISYAADSWWATVTVLPQLRSLKGVTSGNLVLNDHEKLEARFLLSFHL